MGINHSWWYEFRWVEVEMEQLDDNIDEDKKVSYKSKIWMGQLITLQMTDYQYCKKEQMNEQNSMATFYGLRW